MVKQSGVCRVQASFNSFVIPYQFFDQLNRKGWGKAFVTEFGDLEKVEKPSNGQCPHSLKVPVGQWER